MTDQTLDKETREQLADQVKRYLEDEHEIQIGNMDATFLIDFLATNLGAKYYNQGVRDAAAVFARRSDDLADDFYSLEKAELDRK
ncbi:MAG: DUF2164 domain-containing protein [Roseibium sp.]